MMINKFKKYALVFFALLSAGAIIYIIASVKKSSVAPSITPTKPRLSQEYKGHYTLELGLGEKQFNYVEKLPLVQITSVVMTDKKAQEIAGALGFVGDPVSIMDAIDGPTLFWKNGTETLFIYTNQNKVKFSSNKPTFVIDKQLSNETIKATALNFLEEKKVAEKGFLTISTLKFLKKNPSLEGFIESTKNEASLFQIDFAPTGVFYEIIKTSLIEPSIFVVMTKDGVINSFQSTIPDTTRSLPTEYRLKNFKEIESSLDTAVLISVLGQYKPLSSLPDGLIKKITIKGIGLAYLQESSGSTVLIPIYKISGEAVVTNSLNKIPVVLYLPAIANN